MKSKSRWSGRPIRLNRQELKVKAGKDYAELLSISDIHTGIRRPTLRKQKAMMDYALQNGIYVLLGVIYWRPGLPALSGIVFINRS